MVCVAMAATSAHAWRLPIKPPPFLQDHFDKLEKEAQELRDRLEAELQKIKDQLLNAATTTAVPIVEETTLLEVTDPTEEETTVAATEAPVEETTIAVEETTVAVDITTAVKKNT
jgi:hypothetical protein